MIVADSKPLAEIFGYVQNCKKVLVFGCGECVTVCQVGGEKEVAVLAQALRLKAQTEGKQIEFRENTVRRQCDPEFVDPVTKDLGDLDAIVTIACGVGCNFVSERSGVIPCFPGVNTTFMGATIEHGKWQERCLGCGDCILEFTGGICPIARCAKHILNGPCGGTKDGKCEVSTPEDPTECAWAQIYERCKKLGTLDKLIRITPAKDWTTAHDGGPRTRLRPDLMIAKVEDQPAQKAEA
jgi:ferredoxin